MNNDLSAKFKVKLDDTSDAYTEVRFKFDDETGKMIWEIVNEDEEPKNLVKRYKQHIRSSGQHVKLYKESLNDEARIRKNKTHL